MKLQTIFKSNEYYNEINSLPAWVLNSISTLNKDSINMWIELDRNKQGNITNSYLLITKHLLIIVENCKLKQNPVVQYPLEYINSIEVKNRHGGCLLLAQIKGITTIIGCSSLTKQDELIKFVQSLREILSGGIRSAKEEQSVLICPICNTPITDEKGSICSACTKRGSIFLRILHYFQPYRVSIVIAIICSIISSLINAVIPYLNGVILYDQIISGNKDVITIFSDDKLTALLMLVITMASVSLIRHITGSVRGCITAKISPDATRKLKEDVFDRLQHFSTGFFNQQQTGKLMHRLNNDAFEIMRFFMDNLPGLLLQVGTIIFILCLMFSMNVMLSLLFIFMILPIFIVCRFTLAKLRSISNEQNKKSNEMFAYINDNLSGIRVIKAFGQENQVSQLFDEINNEVRVSELHATRFGSLYDFIYNLVKEGAQLMIWTVGAYFVLFRPGFLTYGQLITFTSYLAIFQGPIQFFIDIFRTVASSMNAARRIFTILDAPEESIESLYAKDRCISGAVEFRNVSFRYEKDRPILKKINFQLNATQTLGIIGRSGAGKTTLACLLARLYTPEKGQILIDGIDIRDFSAKSLRGAIAVVSQDIYIFMGTVWQNIAYGNPDIPFASIVQAADSAGAHGFISCLPNGYDTYIGAGGHGLSGGERQRISIARAILSNPKILILDEATASMDTKTEQVVRKALNRLMENRTCICIAHRLSTLRDADKLIVLENGSLVESGTHVELESLGGVYSKLLHMEMENLQIQNPED